MSERAFFPDNSQRRPRLRVRERRVLWFRWWLAWNPDEPLGMMDSHTYIRARSRERVIEKARSRWTPKPVKWEEVRL